MIKSIELLFGRQISEKNIDFNLVDKSLLTKRIPIKVNKKNIQCLRCNQISDKHSTKINEVYYCRNCINLGRIVSDEFLYSAREPNRFTECLSPLTWNGHLTELQAQCSSQICRIFANKENHLLWAVTGAGKTEMLFKGIAWGIKKKLRIAVASPRIDVCVELFPRIQSAFENIEILLLHGKNELPYAYHQVTICTTHQLLKFYHAFDILIIDEVDAFPFVQDAGLKFAAQNAVKESSSILYLTATPSDELLNDVRNNNLSVSYLPIRYHQHLLPLIKNHLILNLSQKLAKNKLNAKIIQLIKQKIAAEQRFLIFVPKIEYLDILNNILSKYFDNTLWASVYSSDTDRLSKVQLMREHKVLFLITTTILERGVTFPEIDVIVFNADHDNFSTSALVQIAGRVGRSANRPNGNVDFFINCKTKNILNAMKQIKYMNKLGSRTLEHE
ncbi:DEAD/DEAH box helicase family protein [Apilactobacillus sp. TMW 2.2459]|uniref:DEAD/DEAH box helicase n=1 Tax=Apilactobacillus xinyiensis TaxID=2841032 RepID=UPI002010979C|nr:helicase-related protein [Apilactobacillus xinyiensis]MCL0312664.1 DEAD/DEAH box helicase family protein [Apilactobacillus xinyiensis]